jgi:hypothetical protein
LRRPPWRRIRESCTRKSAALAGPISRIRRSGGAIFNLRGNIQARPRTSLSVLIRPASTRHLSATRRMVSSNWSLSKPAWGGMTQPSVTLQCLLPNASIGDSLTVIPASNSIAFEKGMTGVRNRDSFPADGEVKGSCMRRSSLRNGLRSSL